MKKSVAKNYLYNLTYQLLALILPLVTAPYVSRILGAENIGIYSYTLSISAYFILFGSLGIALYGQREIAYEQNNKKEYSKTFWEIVILRTITMSISLIIFYCTFVIRNNEYEIYYKILMIEIIGNCIDISWFFQGLEDFQKTVLRNIIVKIISIICIFTFVKSKQDLFIYFIIYVSSILLGNLSLWICIPKYIEKVKFSQLKLLRHFKPTIQLFIPQIAVQVYTLLDKTMIGTIIADKSEVGFYEQSQKIVKMCLTVITSLGIVMLPRIANTYAKGEKKISQYMSKSFNIVFLLSFPMIFGLVSISREFVPVFFGEGYNKVIVLINVISPIIFLIGLSTITGTQFLLPTNRQKEYTTSVICGAVVNFCMNSLLIPKYGAIGASIGTVIAETTVTGVQLYFVRKDFKFLKILKLTVKYLIASLIMFIVCLIVSKIISRNIVSVIVQIIVGILTYAVCLIIMKDDFTLEIINKIRKRLKKETTNV